jgi:hypothetical protein
LKGWAGEPFRRRQWAVSAFSAGWFTLLLYLYLHGALLYRTDFPGVYQPGGFLLYPSSDYLIPAVSAAISFGNVYSAQYLSIFLDVFFVTLGAQIFARELLGRTFSPGTLAWVEGLAATFYLLNPYSLTWSYYALYLELFLHNAAFFLVLALVVRLVRGLRGSGTFGWKDAAWLGLALGLSVPTSFANLARVLMVEGVALLVVALYALGLALARPERRKNVTAVAVRFLVVSVPAAAALLFYPVWQFLTEWLFQPVSLSQLSLAEAALAHPPTAQTFANVLRLLARSNFSRQPFALLYSTNPWDVLTSSLWPVLAILLPLLLTLTPRFRDRAWVWVCELLLVPCILWAVGSGPPFGGVYDTLTGYLPFGPRFLPLFFLVQLLMVKLYVVLVAGALVFLYLEVEGWFQSTPGGSLRAEREASPDRSVGRLSRPRSRRRRRGQLPALVLCLLLTGGLIASTLPILDGALFQAPSSGAQVGFYIPSGYFAASHQLRSRSANALVLPSLEVYVHTAWGYSGATGFYTEFFYPSEMLVPAYYGPYKFYLSSIQASYSQATRVIVPGPNPVPLPLPSTARWAQFNQSRPLYEFLLRTSLNVSEYQWLEVSLPTPDPGLLSNLIASQALKIELFTPGIFPGIYKVGQGGESVVVGENSTSVTVALLLGSPAVGNYSTSDITQIRLRFPSLYDFPALQLGVPELLGVTNSSVAPGWWSLIRDQYHLSYLLVDRTVNGGRTEPLSYGLAVAQVLSSLGLARETLSTPQLELWQLLG